MTLELDPVNPKRKRRYILSGAFFWGGWGGGGGVFLYCHSGLWILDLHCAPVCLKPFV